MQIKALTDWLSRHGAEIRSIAVDTGESGRFVRATRDIPAGETVLRVPRRAMLTLDVARRSPIGAQMLAADIDAPSGHAFLAAYLIAERRRQNSPFAAYIRALPQGFPGVPIYHHREVRAVLRGSFAGSLIVRRREMLLREFVTLQQRVPAFKDVTLAELFWARTAVMTRVFGVKIRGASTEAMVPFADMMNHRRPPDVDWAYDEEQSAFVMKAARDIKEGEEITDSYGRKPNGRYYVHYGFALDSGADDEVELRLALRRDAPHAADKARELRRIGGPENEYRITNKLRHDDTLRVLSFLRTAAAEDKELLRAAQKLAAGEPVPPLSMRNEARALALLDSACAEALSKFDSPGESEDEALLAQGDLPLNLRHAVLVRRGEKRLLHGLRKLAAHAIPLLRLPKRAFFAAASQFSGEVLTASYLLDTALALAPREARPPSFRSVGL
jgi:histone-lysine N-methyltransferase SETD3